MYAWDVRRRKDGNPLGSLERSNKVGGLQGSNQRAQVGCRGGCGDSTRDRENVANDMDNELKPTLSINITVRTEA